MNIEIGSKVVAWNPGAERKVTGTLVGLEAAGNYYRVEWTRIQLTANNGFLTHTHVGTFVNIEVA
jgi:hypothetical protein